MALRAKQEMESSLPAPCVLGFDPGTQVTGYGVLSVKRPVKMIETGAIRPKRGAPLEQRLETIFTRAMELIERFKPTVVAVEDPFVGKSPSSALALGQARGVLLLAAALNGIPLASYPPRAVKMSIVGRGSASKEQVQFMVQRLLNLAEPPQPLDASDALAVALCHVNRGALGPVAPVPSRDPGTLAAREEDAEAIARWKAGGRGRRR